MIEPEKMRAIIDMIAAQYWYAHETLEAWRRDVDAANATGSAPDDMRRALAVTTVECAALRDLYAESFMEYVRTAAIMEVLRAHGK